MRVIVNGLMLLFFLCSQGQADILQVLNNIPQRDREKIELLFTCLVQRETFGFVLFGETKCATFASIPLTHKASFLPYKVENGWRFQRKLKEAWYVWKRYESRLKHPNIIICEEYKSFDNEMYLQLFLIDKKKLRSVLETYHEDFTEVLGDSFSAEKLIAKIEQKKRLRPFIKYDEKLLGILLGFGRESSTLFRDHEDIQALDPPVEYLGKRSPGCPITPVCFRGYSHSPEVKELLRVYNREIVEIETIFKGAEFFEKTMNLLCFPEACEEKEGTRSL